MDLGDIWDSFIDEMSYLIHFEWIGDIGEFFGGLFENLSEFSPIGLLYGFIMVALVFFFRHSIFSFVDLTMGSGKYFVYPIYYIFAFGIGYLMGRKAWE